MKPLPLQDNADLFKYLMRTAQFLRSQNHVQLAVDVERAALFASGSPSEFLHEAQASLERVVSAKPRGFGLVEVHTVINQIKEAFRNVGGA